MGQFLITKVHQGSATVRCSPRLGGDVVVAISHLKYFYEDLELDWAEPLEAQLDSFEQQKLAAKEDQANLADPLALAEDLRPSEPTDPMSASEMRQAGYFEVSNILKVEYKRGWRVLTAWKGYGLKEQTWEPLSAFVLGKNKLNSKLIDFCQKHKLEEPIKQARALAARAKD